MGHKPLGVCSDTLHLNAQPRNLILPKAQGTSAVMGRAAALWTYNYNWSTSAYGTRRPVNDNGCP